MQQLLDTADEPGAHNINGNCAQHLEAEVHGLAQQVTVMSGTSVGALNAALFSCVSPAEAERIRAACRNGTRRFRVTGWHALELLADFPDAVRILSFPFFVANSVAVDAAENVAGIETAPELPAEELELLRRRTALPARPAAEFPLAVPRGDG